MRKSKDAVSSHKFVILVPLALSITILVAAFIYSLLRQEAAYTNEYVGGTFVSAQRIYAAAVKTDTEKLSAALELIVRDDGLRRAMIAHDKAALLQLSLPVFSRLRENYGITHFYFHQPDLINYLRVHQPARYGDKIGRYTATQSRATGQAVSGIELGPLGTFTLRVVFPWYAGKRLLGYVELGEEIEHLLTQITDVSGDELYVTIDKNHLSREDWLAGMAMLGRQAEWGKLNNSVLTFQTGTHGNAHIWKLLAQGYQPSQEMSEITHNDQTLKIMPFPLVDAASREVGQMLLTRDITAQLSNSHRDTKLIITLALLLGTTLFGFFLFLSRRMEARLESSQNELLSSEDRFRALVESSSDWIWEVDENMRYVYASPRIKELLGYEVDEVLGKTPFDLMPPDEAKRVSKAFFNTLTENKPFVALENRNLHRDGREVILETSGVPIFNENGSLRGFRGVDRDITERKCAEVALHKSMQRLTLHFQQTPLAVIEWDSDFRVVDWNQAAERVFGYSESEALGHTAAELIIPESVKDHVDDIWQGLLSGQLGFRSSNENVTKQGNTIFCEWYNTPLVDVNGQIIGVASLAQDVTEQKSAQKKLNNLAYFDDLTGLPNRSLFADRLTQIINDAHRHERLVAVMFMDLDHFKIINDSLGHVAGNLLLQSVAERLKGCFREGDTVARFGGDEFSIALADVSHADDVVQVAQKIVDEFKFPFDVCGSEVFITFSIGITLYPFDDKGTESLLRNADSAMYHAKAQGRNNFQFYSAEMTARSEQRMAIETGLRRAIEREQFVLHYQPQLDIASGKVVGMEALIRWQHPENGLVMPSEFIQIAEETGLIVPIGEWVLRTACAQTRAWQELGLHDLVVAVNLSSRQFKQENLSQRVSGILDETGLDAKYLELEITESLLIDGADADVLFTLEEFKSLGITLAIDDFGTGYSSLSYLKRFPIDKLKIDQSFVRGITNDEDDASLVRAVIAIARSLKLMVIAEGVETEGQLNYLRQQDCDQMQGYYFSRGIPAAEFAALLVSGKSLPVQVEHEVEKY